MDFPVNRGPAPRRARILLVDDNVHIMAHVYDMLSGQYEIVGQIAECDAVCEEVAARRPDVIVLDISLAACSGITIARRLRDKGFTGAIVFLTMHEDADFVAAALDAGGRGYVVKSRLHSDLEVAVREALAHRTFISVLPQHS